MTDVELLKAFVEQRNQAAFEELLRRHSSLVWSTCRRQLKNGPDAEDAFQATFLVLARRARDVKGETLASWLYGVALRVALRARSRACRQYVREKPMQLPQVLSRQEPAAAASDKEMGQILDEELSQLPSKYRTALLLCCLQGQTADQAAQQLGCTRGALVGNLARGRDQLRQRLARRGVVLTGAALVAFLGQQVAVAAVPAGLAASATTAAAAALSGKVAAVSVQAGSLANAAIKSLVWVKVKLWALTAASVALVAAVPAYVLLKPAEKGLIGHYALAETKGTRLADASPSANDGTLVGGVSWVAGPKPGSKALSFDGKTAYVKLDNDVGRWLGGTATVAFWIKTTQVGAEGTSECPCIIGAEVWGDNDVAWGWLHASGRIGIVAGGGTAEKSGDGIFQPFAQSKQPVNDGQWHHVAMTRDVSTAEVRLYVDGAFQEAATSGPGQKTCPLTDIGRLIDNKGTKRWFAGALHDVRLYSRVLTAQEIQALAHP
jgi:RNA polymerase sigma factor (sigma-70 family)